MLSSFSSFTRGRYSRHQQKGRLQRLVTVQVAMSSVTNVFDVCVVGAGIMGCATARHLAKMGQRTMLLEQFPLPHWRGSSHGQSRLFRSIYEEPYFVKMATEAGKMWEDIEQQAGEEIFIKNMGFLTVEETPFTRLKESAKQLGNNAVEHEFLTPSQLKSMFPDLYFSSSYSGVLEKSAGVLKADKCLKHLQEQFVRFGGTLHDGQKVLSIQPDTSGVTITTNKTSYRANKIILTAGPWTNKLLKPLGLEIPLKVCRAPACYWNITKPGAYTSETGFPSYYDCTASDSRYTYCLVNPEYPDMLKLGPTGESQKGIDALETDPDRRDSDRQAVERFIQKASHYIREHFPYLDHRQPAIVEMCLYSITPDRHFVLDKHPGFENIIIGAGFSGHGFKHAPVVGQILSELALGRPPSYDLTPFKITRFSSKPLKSSL